MNLADESNEFTATEYEFNMNEFIKRIVINNKKQHPSLPICSCSPYGEDRLPLTSSLSS